MVCLCKFKDVTDISPWCEKLKVGEIFFFGGGTGIGGNSVLSAQFCCHLKTALKNIVNLRKMSIRLPEILDGDYHSL